MDKAPYSLAWRPRPSSPPARPARARPGLLAERFAHFAQKRNFTSSREDLPLAELLCKQLRFLKKSTDDYSLDPTGSHT